VPTAKCLAIMYHYVRDRADGAESDIRGLDVASFTEQIDSLGRTLEPIDWPTFVAWRTGRRSIPQRSFLLTFDDGLSDHADVVAPILESRGLHGVFFVQSSVLVDQSMVTAHQIHLLLCKMDAATLLDLVRRRAPSNGTAAPKDRLIALEAKKRYSYETPERADLKHYLTHVLPVEARNTIVADLFAEHVGDPHEYARRWYMDWDQLSQMQRAGHTIGGHGHSHEPYDRLTVSQQAADMARCSAVLRDGLGREARPFSYPYGVLDEDIARRCAFAGFVNGFTTQRGWIGAFDDAHRLRRVDTIHADAVVEREFSCTPH
jgi:peptidoglycan/xylan/chitin deacetylase (PgdA/CDA1 family)